MSSLLRRRLPRAAVAVAVVVSAAAAAHTTTAVAASGATVGRVLPQVAAAPHWTKVGTVADSTTFSCQLVTPPHCYGPTQIRAAYGVSSLRETGAGSTIVIIDAFQSPTIATDLATFDSTFGLPAPTLNVIAPDGLTPFNQNDPDQTGWAGEITLDVEYAHAIAPAATIDLVLAKSDFDPDIFSAEKYAVDNDLGDVISMSFGEAEQCMSPTQVTNLHALWDAAGQKHITLLASAGDVGAAQYTCDGSSFFKAVSSPASDPDVTGVGGTILKADGLTGAYQSETTWNEPNFASAGGGGLSVNYPVPSYQAGLNLTARGVPDVAYNAAIVGGVLTVWSTSGQGANLIFTFGGTSAGSPQWAGLVALADQRGGHHRIGQLNPELYALANQSQTQYAALFHDITTGDNSDFGITGYSAGTGYDLATGLGSPKADALIPAIAVEPTTTTLSASQANVAVNQPVTFTATVHPTSGVTPSGTVGFYLDGATTAAATVPVTSGQAAWTPTLGFGTHSVIAEYNGDPANGPSTSAPVTVTVGGCTSVITGTHSSLTITGGVTCIGNATITGGIVVGRGGTLDLENSTVLGSITASSATTVRICGSTTGSIGVTDTAGPVVVGEASAYCPGNHINGSLTVTNNHGGGSASDNTISGSWLITSNAPPVTATGNHH